MSNLKQIIKERKKAQKSASVADNMVHELETLIKYGKDKEVHKILDKMEKENPKQYEAILSKMDLKDDEKEVKDDSADKQKEVKDLDNKKGLKETNLKDDKKDGIDGDALAKTISEAMAKAMENISNGDKPKPEGEPGIYM